MSSEEGIVTRTKGDRAWVRVSRSAMCDQCGSRGACHSLGGGGDREAEALNAAGAVPGDRVRITLPTGSLLGIAFLFYVPPVLALIGGALGGLKLGPRLGIEAETASLAAALGAFALTVALLMGAGRLVKKSERHMAKVSAVLPPGPAGCEDPVTRS